MNKICNTCSIEKEINEFHIKKATKDGYYNTCKDCRKLKSKDYYWSHREEIIERNTEYFFSNRDKLYTYKRQWYNNNPEKVREIYERKKNTESHKINTRLNKHKRRTIINNLGNDGTVTKKSLSELFNKIDSCIYCGIVKNENFHLDHINPLSRGGGHTISNLQFICPTCNLRKHDKNHDEFTRILLPSAAANLTEE